SPFTTPKSELSLLMFDPTLFALFLSPFVYFVMFRPWMRRVSLRKQAEEMRIEQERIEYARKVKNEFLTNMSHTLRTPLNSIMGFSELLRQKASGALNEKQEHYVNNILTSGNTLLAAIGDMLDLSNLEIGKMELAFQKIYLSEVIDETIAPLKEKAEKQKVLIKKELDPALEYINADKYVLNKVLVNLLHNAIKFSKDEGGIVTITTQKDGDMARISISDTGFGIREEDMKRLFTQFPHIDSETPRRFEGTGLGLALSKQLVELHGGKIWAKSKFDEGSTFAFLLPINAGKTVETK
ncbi:MAG: HAMP domain-containing sensor histidine kinase, partial [Candidatus Methanoperedens sp.]